MDAADIAGAVLVGQLDGIIQASLAEVLPLLSGGSVEGFGIVGIGEDSVLGDDLAELPVHDAGVPAQGDFFTS